MNHHQLFPDHLLETARRLWSMELSPPIVIPLDADTFKNSGGQPGDMLSETELAAAAAYTLPKRRREYFAGRLCVKLALRQYYAASGLLVENEMLRAITVDNLADRRPQLTGRLPKHPPSPHISISHSNDMVAAMVAPYPCGIDLESPRPTLLRVQQRFCSDEEADLVKTILPHTTKLNRLLSIWCAKEAVQKALSHQRMPGLDEMSVIGAEYLGQGVLLLTLIPGDNLPLVQPGEIYAIFTTMGDSGLAMTVAPGDTADA